MRFRDFTGRFTARREATPEQQSWAKYIGGKPPEPGAEAGQFAGWDRSEWGWMRGGALEQTEGRGAYRAFRAAERERPAARSGLRTEERDAEREAG
ncbi:MAG: hypothetical protein ACRDPY_04035 [Streptosporangiaceae bacterium]